MKWILFALIFLAACSHKETVDKPAPQKLGWSSAGLSIETSEVNFLGTGIESVERAGEFLFARNDRVIDGKRRSQLFLGKVGSLLWKELELPEGDVPNVLYSDGRMLFV